MNTLDRKALINRLVPLVDLRATSNEIRIQCDRYYGRFIKEMREIRGPLDELLRKDSKWEWTEKRQNAFEKAKKILSSDLLLTHYDPKLSIVVAADASQHGIGATISHIFPDKTEKIIEHASLSFTAAQRNYSQIEKEVLALVFAVQKFHRMLYGRRFTLQTDHKPLLAIFGSKTGIPIYAASRLQRWALILTNYDFDVKYVKTESFGKADVLSRLIADYPRPEEDVLIANICTETELFINSIHGETANPLPITAETIGKATEEDSILQKLLNFTIQGWPLKCKDPDLVPYYPKRHEISKVENCLVYGNRTSFPKSCKNPSWRHSISLLKTNFYLFIMFEPNYFQILQPIVISQSKMLSPSTLFLFILMPLLLLVNFSIEDALPKPPKFTNWETGMLVTDWTDWEKLRVYTNQQGQMYGLHKIL